MIICRIRSATSGLMASMGSSGLQDLTTWPSGLTRYFQKFHLGSFLEDSAKSEHISMSVILFFAQVSYSVRVCTGDNFRNKSWGGGGRCHHSKSGQRAKHRPEQTSRSECPDPVHTHTEAPLTQDSATQSHEAMYLRSVALNNTKFVLSLAENFQFLGMFKDKMIF